MLLIILLTTIIASAYGNDVVLLLVNPDNPDELVLTNDNIDAVNSSLHTIIVSHGWRENRTTFYYKALTEAYMNRGEYNVILIDWGSLAFNNYLSASGSVKTVGEYVGKFLNKMHDQIGVNMKKVHLIGHSLGAHVVSYIGKTIIKEGRKVARITGLDPAGPLFYIPCKRLRKSDGEIVDVLHTTAQYGIIEPIGDVDFYANSLFAKQPGCDRKLFQECDAACKFCSHQNSVRYYIETINKVEFKAKNCHKWLLNNCKNAKTTLFGEDMPLNTKGVYYFKTEPEAPYAKND